MGGLLRLLPTVERVAELEGAPGLEAVAEGRVVVVAVGRFGAAVEDAVPVVRRAVALPSVVEAEPVEACPGLRLGVPAEVADKLGELNGTDADFLTSRGICRRSWSVSHDGEIDDPSQLDDQKTVAQPTAMLAWWLKERVLGG